MRFSLQGTEARIEYKYISKFWELRFNFSKLNEKQRRYFLFNHRLEHTHTHTHTQYIKQRSAHWPIRNVDWIINIIIIVIIKK